MSYILFLNRSKFISPNLFRFYAKSNDDIDAELSKPVKYTASPAYEWRASNSRIGSKAEFGPWYEPHVVTISIVVFMVYFFVLREENDLDALLEKPLSELNFQPNDDSK